MNKRKNWFRVKVRIWPSGYHYIYISRMGHSTGGVWLEVSYNGKLYGKFYKKWKVGELEN